MKALFIGGKVARIGRRKVQQLLPSRRNVPGIDMVMAHSENVTSGNNSFMKLYFTRAEEYAK